MFLQLNRLFDRQQTAQLRNSETVTNSTPSCERIFLMYKRVGFRISWKLQKMRDELWIELFNRSAEGFEIENRGSKGFKSNFLPVISGASLSLKKK